MDTNANLSTCRKIAMNIFYIILLFLFLSLWVDQSIMLHDYIGILSLLHLLFGSISLTYVIYITLFYL